MGRKRHAVTPLQYYVDFKNRPLSEAVRIGFDAEAMPMYKPVFRKVPERLHIVTGLQYGALDIMQRILATGAEYVFCDRAYYGGGARSGRFRLTLNAYQKNWINTPAALTNGHSRLDAWGVAPQPWRTDGDKVMVVPPSEAVEKLYGINWARDWLPKIQEATRREVIVSPKRDREESPIFDRLPGVHCVVTWTSNVAVDAILFGIPAITHGDAAAAPVAGDLRVLDIENPPRPDRAAWAESLAWGQFSIDEIRAGFARRVLLGR